MCMGATYMSNMSCWRCGAGKHACADHGVCTHTALTQASRSLTQQRTGAPAFAHVPHIRHLRACSCPPNTHLCSCTKPTHVGTANTASICLAVLHPDSCVQLRARHKLLMCPPENATVLVGVPQHDPVKVWAEQGHHIAHNRPRLMPPWTRHLVQIILAPPALEKAAAATQTCSARLSTQHSQ